MYQWTIYLLYLHLKLLTMKTQQTLWTLICYATLISLPNHPSELKTIRAQLNCPMYTMRTEGPVCPGPKSPGIEPGKDNCRLIQHWIYYMQLGNKSSGIWYLITNLHQGWSCTTLGILSFIKLDINFWVEANQWTLVLCSSVGLLWNIKVSLVLKLWTQKTVVWFRAIFRTDRIPCCDPCPCFNPDKVL